MADKRHKLNKMPTDLRPPINSRDNAANQLQTLISNYICILIDQVTVTITAPVIIHHRCSVIANASSVGSGAAGNELTSESTKRNMKTIRRASSVGNKKEAGG